MGSVLLFAVVLIGAAGGCKNKNDADAAPDPTLEKQQQDLISRRDSLMNERQKLAQEHDKTAEQLQQAKTRGENTEELAKRLDDIDEKLKKANQDTDKFLQEVPIAPPRPAGGGDGAAPDHSAEVTRQLAELARLEDAARQREREASPALAKAARAAADRWKDSCNLGGGSVIVQQVQAPKGSNYTKSDIQPLLQKARATMAKKGIRQDDLGAAANLEGESTKAMADGDWGKAYLAAAQLSATVDQVKIDKAFIQNKFARISQYVAAHKDVQGKPEVSQALSDITQKYGDGDYAGTNKRINDLWSVLAR